MYEPLEEIVNEAEGGTRKGGAVLRDCGGLHQVLPCLFTRQHSGTERVTSAVRMRTRLLIAPQLSACQQRTGVFSSPTRISAERKSRALIGQ
ncbi:uncharacterized [Tachysurus ichikawai]